MANPVQVSTWPGPAGYHSGHVSACSSNEKCLAVNEINTDIRLSQQEQRGEGEWGRGVGWRVTREEEREGGGGLEEVDVKERRRNKKHLEERLG